MFLYTRSIAAGSPIIAKHDETQSVAASLYGVGVLVVAVPDGTLLSRVGTEPDAHMPDTRPEGMPALVGAVLAHAIKAECRRRIVARLSDSAQKNMAIYFALAAAAVASPAVQADFAVLQEIHAWRGRPSGMQGLADALIAAGDLDFLSEAKWPAWSPAWSDFVARF